MKNIINIKSPSILSEKEIITEILDHLKSRKAVSSYVEIEVIEDVKMKKLNSRFMRKNRPTDVLSFPLPDIPGEKQRKSKLIGTVVLCGDIIKQNAKENNKDERDEFKFVLRHGLDHLLGIHHK